MVKCSGLISGWEGVIIPAKVNAREEAGGLRFGDAAGKKPHGGYESQLREIRMGFSVHHSDHAPGAPASHPALGLDAVRNPTSNSNRLTESVRPMAAQHAAWDEDFGAEQRLAARFVRRSDEPVEPARLSKMAALKTQLAAAALLVVLASAMAVYFLKADGAASLNPAGSAFAAAALQGPFEAPAVQSEPAAKPMKSGGHMSLSPAKDPGGADSWASAVETFRMLSATLPAPERRVAGKPDSKRVLEQLTAWQNLKASH